jgi:hypothetical protein
MNALAEGRPNGILMEVTRTVDDAGDPATALTEDGAETWHEVVGAESSWIGVAVHETDNQTTRGSSPR